MKKNPFSFALLSGLLFFAACGPSAEEQAEKEKARQDSIRQVELADSLAKAAQAKLDSIAAAESARQDSLAAIVAKPEKKSPAPKTKKPKEEKKSEEEQTKEKMSSRRGTAVPTTTEEKKNVEETKKKMEGRRK